MVLFGHKREVGLVARPSELKSVAAETQKLCLLLRVAAYFTVAVTHEKKQLRKGGTEGGLVLPRK